MFLHETQIPNPTYAGRIPRRKELYNPKHTITETKTNTTQINDGYLPSPRPRRAQPRKSNQTLENSIKHVRKRLGWLGYFHWFWKQVQLPMLFLGRPHIYFPTGVPFTRRFKPSRAVENTTGRKSRLLHKKSLLLNILNKDSLPCGKWHQQKK